MSVALDHLVVAAASLDDGVRWCESVLGVTPGAGGRHALMSTHNRLLSIASPRFECAYLEIVAVDPAAPPPPRRRWFGLDEAALQAALQRDGPRLVHWVARSSDLDATRAALLAAGIEPGAPVAASRGRFRWRITLRDEGRPLCRGAAPALIEWAGAHPAESMAGSRVELRSLVLTGLDAQQAAALELPAGITIDRDGAAGLTAQLSSPRGVVTLRS